IRADKEQLARKLEEARASQALSLARIVELEGEARNVREDSARTVVAARTREAESETRRLARTQELENASAVARDRAADLERDLVRHRDALHEARAHEERARELLAIVTEDREGVVARATELASTADEARARAAAEAETLRASLTSAQALIFQAEESARRARA